MSRGQGSSTPQLIGRAKRSSLSACFSVTRIGPSFFGGGAHWPSQAFGALHYRALISHFGEARP